MRYTDFRDAIQRALREHAEGLTWPELRSGLSLPYDRPCPDWTKRLEQEIGLSRERGAGRALVWRVTPSGRKQRSGSRGIRATARGARG